ncbi:hypothetical protein MCHI_002262 [Candidatus Magnetoovum chiemensis]|nr:hypothetical protein MCHI_002262 [Candidatus Magnetoovum chiemensis]
MKDMSEAKRYIDNAIETLKRSPIENNRYLDKKFVREACGTAYLVILEALDYYLLKQGVEKKKLPKSVEGYMTAIKKYLSIHNGKLIGEFNSLYDALHIAGHYRGLIDDTEAIKAYFKRAKEFIKKLE